jgi:hypothetical protein
LEYGGCPPGLAGWALTIILMRRVFRRGGGKKGTRVGAIMLMLLALTGMVIALLPTTVPLPVQRILAGSVEAWPPAFAARLAIGMGSLTALIIAGGLWYLAPYLGGTRIILTDDGLEYVDHTTWRRLTWCEIQDISYQEETQTYTILAGSSCLSFGHYSVDGADTLAMLIKEHCTHEKP